MSAPITAFGPALVRALISQLKTTLPYLDAVAARSPTLPAGLKKVADAKRDAAAIRETIATVEGVLK